MTAPWQPAWLRPGVVNWQESVWPPRALAYAHGVLADGHCPTDAEHARLLALVAEDVAAAWATRPEALLEPR